MIPSAGLWQHLFLDLVVSVTIAVAATAVLSRWLAHPPWRRSLWQACTLALIGIFAIELVGLNRELAAPLQRLLAASESSDLPGSLAALAGETGASHHSAPATQASDQNRDSNNLSDGFSSSPAVSTVYLESFPTGDRTELASPIELVAKEQPAGPDSGLTKIEPTTMPAESGWLKVWWPGLLWLLGAGLVAARAGTARLLLLVVRFRHPRIEDTEFSNRFDAIARRLGIRNLIRVIEIPGLMSPLVFGTFRPVIALPTTFFHDPNHAKQEVMLAHELAHVAGRDPAWLLAADVMTALLWWHPLAWWCRHQLHSACEEAADEASLLVADGPTVLAACLVELGGRLLNNPQVGGASVAGNGFRSSLGRRVDRLLQLNGRSWTGLSQRGLPMLSIVIVPILLIAITLSAACMPWSGDRGTPRGLSKGDNSMTSLRHSIAGMALCALLAPASDSEAQDVPKPTPSPIRERKIAEPPQGPTESIPEPPQPVRSGATAPIQDPSLIPSAGDQAGSAVANSEPAQIRPPAFAPQRIKIFRLTHRQPGEVLEILGGFTPIYEGGAQGNPVAYTEFLAQGLNSPKPGMPTGGGGGGLGGGKAMMGKMGAGPVGGGGMGMGSMMSGPGGSVAPSPTCYFAIDQRTRSLIVRGTEKDLQAVADFVAILDLPDDKAIPKLKNIHAFKLRFAKPSDVIGVLKALNIDVLLSQIPKSNIVLVNGPDSAIKEATEIIEALDAEVKDGPAKDNQDKTAPTKNQAGN